MKYKNILFLLCLSTAVWSQDTIVRSQMNSVKKAAVSLSQSLEEDQPADTVAFNYVNLAKELVSKGDYTRAENYLSNAQNLFKRMNNTEQTAIVTREIAKVQEAQKNYRNAQINFDVASKLSTNQSFKELNLNDYKRLQNISDPLNQSVYIQRNLNLLDKTNNKEDQVIALQQMAEVNLVMNNKDAALSNLREAIEVVEDKPLEVAKMQREIANVYVADSQFEKAVLSLKQAYELALREGNTLEAKRTLELLVEQYRKGKNNNEALNLYADFISKLEPLVKNDSTLIDDKFFEVHEARIAQLEKERILKDELIHKQNTINSVLIFSLVVILLFLLLCIKAWYSIRQRNKRIALQSLRREMNPHFIFNSLNSVNQFIAQNNELEANRYLTSYSKLMRNMMENSNKDFTTLATELEQIREYLDLEHRRFKDKFRYEIKVDETIDTETVYVPGMLIQPQIENAIWHGLRYLEKDGFLRLYIDKVKDNICVTIEDNGIGLKRSKELKTKHQKEHKSRGLTNTSERIALLNSLYGSRITMDIKEKEGTESGVIVRLCYPVKKVK